MARPLNNLRYLAQVPLVNGRNTYVLATKVSGVQETPDGERTNLELDTGTILEVNARIENVVRALDEFLNRVLSAS